MSEREHETTDTGAENRKQRREKAFIAAAGTGVRNRSPVDAAVVTTSHKVSEKTYSRRVLWILCDTLTFP